LQHEQATRHLSIEDRLKDYNDKYARYHEKFQCLEEEKKELKRGKQSLELEVRQLREQLDAISIASHGSTLATSQRKPYSLSDSSLTSKDKEFKSVSTLCMCIVLCVFMRVCVHAYVFVYCAACAYAYSVVCVWAFSNVRPYTV